MLAYYRSLREKNGLTHEEAIRDSIVSVLMSPKFCYRIDLHGTPPRDSAGMPAKHGGGASSRVTNPRTRASRRRNRCPATLSPAG